jgi:hypothetical protein
MHPPLSFEQAPPVASTFRFFLTAPWFGVAAGLLLAWRGPAALASRWTPEALALTHLLTAGFMLQAMSGALLQIVPVVAAGAVARARAVAAVLHALLASGALLLAGAMLCARPAWIQAAAVALGAGVALLVVSAGAALIRPAAPPGPTLAALRAALAALAATAAMGVALARALGGAGTLPLERAVDSHAATGLGAWALVLLAGVSFVVVPMFQLTPAYPRALQRAVPVGLFALVAVWAAAALAGADAVAEAAAIGALGLVAAFALTTLRLQRRRRRARTDTTFAFFRGAMIALLLADGLLLLQVVDGRLAARPQAAVLTGILLMGGVFASAICGMLYKIVPFTCWLKLAPRRAAPASKPGMARFLDESAMRPQMRLHFLALGLLLAAVALPWLARPAGLAFAASCGWLGINLARATLRYARLTSRIPAAGAGGES